MQTLDVLRERVDLVARDCQSASKSLAVIDPFISNKEFGALQFDEKTPGIVSVITDKLSRYAIICMARIWDESGGVASLKQTLAMLRKSSEKDAHKDFYEQYKALITANKTASLIKTVRDWRHNFGAHTSANPFTIEFGHNYLQLKELHIQTASLVDQLYEIVFERGSSLKYSFESWCDDAKHDWIKMLRPLNVPTPPIGPELRA